MSELKVDRRQILAELQSLPLLSQSAARVLEISNDPEHSVAEISRVIETDSALTANILKVVNSSAFSLVKKVHSVEQAISYLGKNTVVGIALGYSCSSLYHGSLDGYNGQKGDLWEHSLRTALAARELAKLTYTNVPPDLGYTAGLLHDIGKPILSKFTSGTAPKILSYLDNVNSGDFLDAERQMYGIDHAEVGAELGELWNLPEPLKEAIRYHHRPGQASETLRPLVYTVHLGDMISMMEGAGTGADSMNYQLDPEYATHINISNDDLQMILLTIESDLDKTKKVLLGEEER